MKKVLLLICLLVVASAAQLLAYTPITQGKYYVSTTGDDQANTGLTVGSPFRTIQFAVNQSLSPGDIILVRGGTYAEKVYISSVKNGVAGAPIVLAAYGTETPIITGVSTSVTNGFARDIEVDGSYWLLQGLTVMDSYSNPTRDLYPMHEWFWVLINGSNVHMKSCRLVYPGIVRTVADFAFLIHCCSCTRWCPWRWPCAFCFSKTIGPCHLITWRCVIGGMTSGGPARWERHQ